MPILPAVEANSTCIDSSKPSSIGSCVAINEPKPAEPEPGERRSNDDKWKRQLIHESLGAEKVAMLKAYDMLSEVESILLPVMYDDDGHVLPMQNWVDTEIELTLDSGCCEHVMDVSDAAGYEAHVVESSGSRRGQHFVVGNGQRVPNEGQLHLNMEYQGIPLRSVFQIAEVTRPLMSVGRVCDQGFKCTFDDKEALIIGQNNNVVCRFER